MNKSFFWLSASLVAMIMVLLVAAGVLISGRRYYSVSVDGYGKIYYYGTKEEGSVYYPREKATYVAAESALYYENGDCYQGEIENYLPNGQGVYTTASGEILEGSFADGLLEGYGKQTFVSGNIYQGSFAGGVPNGKGTMTVFYDDTSEVLTCVFLAGNPAGTLTYLYKNGASYEGGYRNGLADGEGKLTFPNGDVYQGSFVGGEFSGLGEYTFADGSVYSGQFENSMPDGIGSYTYEENGIKKRLSGSFVNGIFVDQPEVSPQIGGSTH